MRQQCRDVAGFVGWWPSHKANDIASLLSHRWQPAVIVGQPNP
jgi:hypothetical protein